MRVQTACICVCLLRLSCSYAKQCLAMIGDAIMASSHNMVEHVYNGHCILPIYNSQVTESQKGLQCTFEHPLTGHHSITATFGGPMGYHYRQVPLYHPCSYSSVISCNHTMEYIAYLFFSLYVLVPHISTYDVFVTEGPGIVARVVFNRTGGDLEIRSRIVAGTMQTTGTQNYYWHTRTC